ncbi:MAG TPA: hypothetical protein GXZ73_00555 [Herbinix luporum]|jgi:hypothetical protein|nr:hypothetical protein [Herbinix luporum]
MTAAKENIMIDLLIDLIVLTEGIVSVDILIVIIKDQDMIRTIAKYAQEEDPVFQYFQTFSNF